MNASVVMTGQLRTPDRLLRSLADWRGMPEIARTIIVTWREEASEQPELCARIRDLGAELITPPMPPVRGIGHVWPQTLALKIGLDLLGPEELVFKTRADLHMDPAFLRTLVTTPGYLDRSERTPAVFERRIWLPWFELTKPFYMADECMLGRAHDLARLNNFDESYSLLWDIGCGVTHIRRFIHPFRAHTDAFEPFLERYTDAGHFSEARWERLGELLADDGYLRTLAAYYAAVAGCFRIDCPDGAVAFRDWSSHAPQPPLAGGAASFETAFVRTNESITPGGHLMAHGESWLRTVLTGDLTGAHAERFAAAVSDCGWPVELPEVDLPEVDLGETERAVA